MKILAVIPARGGSKGIPRKNARLMNGKPLIAYAISNAKAVNLIMDTVVTTDDKELLAIAGLYGVEVIERRPELAVDTVTLDPVICDAVLQMEERKGQRYDIVVTLQPTSPLLKSSTLKRAILEFAEGEADSCISVVNHAHLSWGRNKQGFFPHYEERRNRQQLPPNYMETGAFFISKREVVTESSRLGKRIDVYEVAEREAVDIDTARDWVLCEQELRKKRVVFRVDGFRERGMGHIYHCLTLAWHMTGQDVLFVTNKNCREGYEKLKESFLPLHTIEREEDFYEFLEAYRPDVVVNDCLNTTKEHILRLKKYARRVVSVEDLGEGALYADAVINALYDVNPPNRKHFVGSDYVCIRDEFVIRGPKPFSEQVKYVLVLFGGTDPANLGRRMYRLVGRMREIVPDAEFHFITGGGEPEPENGIESREEARIYVHKNVKNMSDYMGQADLAFTSQGRTVFELAVMGVPSIVLAQNEREQLHTFAQMGNGFLNLGLGERVADETVVSTFRWLVQTPQIRREMRTLMLRHKLWKSTERVLDIILEDVEERGRGEQ